MNAHLPLHPLQLEVVSSAFAGLPGRLLSEADLYATSYISFQTSELDPYPSPNPPDRTFASIAGHRGSMLATLSMLWMPQVAL